MWEKFNEWTENNTFWSTILSTILGAFGTSIITALFNWLLNLNLSTYIYIIVALFGCLLVLFIKYLKLKKKSTETNYIKSLDIGTYHRYNLKDFLMSADKNIFFVGITNSGVLLPCEKLIEVLDKGIEINILIESDTELLKVMCDFFYGKKLGARYVDINSNQNNNIVDIYSELPKIQKYLDSNQIHIRKLPTIISTSYIAVDITNNYQQINDNGVIQATFYQYQLDTAKCPCIRIDKNNSEIYANIGESILNMWKDSEEII